MSLINYVYRRLNLFDPSAEETLDHLGALRQFVGINLDQELVPDGATIWKLRYLSERLDLRYQLFHLVNHYLKVDDLKVSSVTIVDACNISELSSTKNRKKQRDPEIRLIREVEQRYLVMRTLTRVDSRLKLIHWAVATCANIRDSQVLPDLLLGGEARELADFA